MSQQKLFLIIKLFSYFKDGSNLLWYYIMSLINLQYFGKYEIEYIALQFKNKRSFLKCYLVKYFNCFDETVRGGMRNFWNVKLNINYFQQQIAFVTIKRLTTYIIYRVYHYVVTKPKQSTANIKRYSNSWYTGETL